MYNLSIGWATLAIAAVNQCLSEIRSHFRTWEPFPYLGSILVWDFYPVDRGATLDSCIY